MRQQQMLWGYNFLQMLMHHELVQRQFRDMLEHNRVTMVQVEEVMRQQIASVEYAEGVQLQGQQDHECIICFESYKLG